MQKVCFVLIFFCLGTIARAQNTRDTEAPRTPRPQYQAFKKEKKSVFSFLKKRKKIEFKTNQEEVADFRARIRQVNREKIREERKANKPQFTNHEYFGHKRPPKKRPPGKQKFCKVCKIKH